MKLLYLHNDYARTSGEETGAEVIVSLLREHGHEVAWHRRNSDEIIGTVSGNVKAMFTGLWNPCESAAVKRQILEFDPDIVQVQNVYPLLSPSIFGAIKSCGKPLVMRCPNYRLFCPNGLCYNGEICEKCFGGREWNCLFNNCEGNLLKSLGYALRSWLARVTRRILDNVDIFIVQTEFQKRKFISQGIPEEKLEILPGIMSEPAGASEWKPGNNVTFIGRVSREKGIEDFLEAARRLPDIPFVVAGAYEGMAGIRENSPANVEWRGFLQEDELRRAYLDSRIVVVPSRCYEGFPNVIVSAMMLERPIITANIGATGSIITHENNGYLFESGNVEQLAERIRRLYSDESLCRKFGEAGGREAERLYSRDRVYERLMGIYEKIRG